MDISSLISKYEKEKSHYVSSRYNETQLRSDFLDPFFELLGWDIKNKNCKLTNEREVLLEEGLKANFSENTKKPDYTFRLFSERKFFLEAKKPSVKIENDNESAKQVRRYGFTAKLKISVLSNFEYLIIYDCSEKVLENDLYSKNRINIYHYTEYIDKFEEIKIQLGRESVYSGNFDNNWNHIEEQLKRFSVDKLFLEQINNWRLILGKEIYKHKSEIKEVELNDIVQSYINSLIFLRVCEDRNLEAYKTLFNFANNSDFKSLIKTFKDSDKKYNSGLFSHKLTKEIIENNSSAFWNIIKQLYYPESTYSFSVFSSDILGNIYEIFLGQKLVIRDNKISIETKPEHIERDIVTTPTFIIRDILRDTIQEYCKDKTDIEILNSSFADISCGSGAFLLEAYQLINDILIDYYLKNSKEKLIQTSIDTYKLPFDIKNKIVKNCIFGVDKDFNAVESCKFALLLKLLEQEDNSTIPHPALPDLSNNIHFGNSLISSDLIVDKDQIIINPFDFGNTKYDVIIGNPPYMSTEHMKDFLPLELPIYKKSYFSAYQQFDKYFLFIEKGINLLKDNGYLGYIVPNKFTKVGSGTKLRELLKNSTSLQKIVSFGAIQVFQDKSTYSCLLILQKSEQKKLNYTEIKNISDWKIRNIKSEIFDSIEFSNLDNELWKLVSGDIKPAFEKINNQSISLENLVGIENIYNGIQTSANDIYINKALEENDKYIYFEKDNKKWKIEKSLTRPYYKTAKGLDNLNTYRILTPNSFVIYPYIKVGNKIEFVDINRLQLNYPNLYEYLLSYKIRLDNPKRDIKPIPTTKDEWYRYGRSQCLDKCDVPAKIIVGVLSQGNKYAIDYNSTLISSGGTAGYCMITLPDNCQYSIYYIQALLNSKYLEWFSSLSGEVFRGGYIARGTKVLKKLPIRSIDFQNNIDKQLHDSITSIQKRLIDIQKEIDSNNGNNRLLTPFKRQFELSKNELNTLLIHLFNLGDDDILIPLISEVYATN